MQVLHRKMLKMLETRRATILIPFLENIFIKYFLLDSENNFRSYQ